MSYIYPVYFIGSLIIGIIIIYITTPPPKSIIVYPTPDNYNKFQYQDDAGYCFTIKQTEMSCPESDDDIYSIQMQ